MDPIKQRSSVIRSREIGFPLHFNIDSVPDKRICVMSCRWCQTWHQRTNNRFHSALCKSSIYVPRRVEPMKEARFPDGRISSDSLESPPWSTGILNPTKQYHQQYWISCQMQFDGHWIWFKKSHCLGINLANTYVTHAPITPNFPSGSSRGIVGGIMFLNRCWPIVFHTITDWDADKRCRNWLVWSAPW